MAPSTSEHPLTAPPPPPVPLFDLELADADVADALEVVRRGALAAGATTAAFEQAFSRHLGVRESVAVSSCTAALHLALRAIGVGPGDEVVVPSFTFVATAAAARYCGAEPVFADVLGTDRPVVDPAGVAACLTPRTRAVVAVHFGGYAAPVHELRELCDRRGIALVEDAAHAPWATSDRGALLGTVGSVSCFSLFSNKVLSVGEGGLLCTDDDALARRARRPVDGLNARFDDVRAALGSARLRGLRDDVRARRRLTHRYRRLLRPLVDVEVPFDDADVERSSCYVMPVMLGPDVDRAVVRERMSARGVQTSVLYPAIHEFTAYRGPTRRPLPATEACAARELTLPLFPHLSPADQDRVVDALAEGLSAGRRP